MSAESPQNMLQVKKDRDDARRRLWRRGHLEWKFEKGPWAKEMYDFTRKRWGASPYLVWFVHRRGWKSSTGLVIGMEECLREPNTRCGIICKTKDQAQEICDVSMVELTSDCPKELRPRKIKNDYAYTFHNGSFLKIHALDGKQGLKVRGRKFRFLLITEFGFIDNIDKILRSSILPTLRSVLGETTGTLVLESTPPEEAGHPMQTMVEQARLEDRLFELPLSKNKHAHPDFIEQVISDSGGRETIEFRREYELEFVVDDERTAIPEFTQERATVGDVKKGLPPIVREVAYPPESDHYESLDPGGSDLTGWLGGTYVFEHDLLYIEDELPILNMTTDDLAAKVREKETELWGAAPLGKIRRFGDNNNGILLFDLWKKHSLQFLTTLKDNKDAQINAIRLMVRDGRLAIHPRCKKLIMTLRIAKRAKQANRGFERMDEIGHADLLDCLIYLARNVKRRDLPKAPAVRAAEADIRAPTIAQYRSDQDLGRLLRGGRIGMSRFRR